MTKTTREATEELIHAVADATGESVREQLEALMRECCNCLPNYYHAMEKLLRKYKELKELAEQEEEYLQLRERDRSIVAAPPVTGVARSEIEAREERAQERREAYARTMTQFDRLESIVCRCANRPEFIVIRMRYFNEDPYGNDRGPDAERYTFQEMEEALAEAGTPVTAKTLGKWRTELVRDMVVLMWGVNGAVSLETPRRLQTEALNG